MNRHQQAFSHVNTKNADHLIRLLCSVCQLTTFSCHCSLVSACWSNTLHRTHTSHFINTVIPINSGTRYSANPRSTVGRSQLRSAEQTSSSFTVITSFHQWSFGTTGPAAWNEMLLSMRSRDKSVNNFNNFRHMQWNLFFSESYSTMSLHVPLRQFFLVVKFLFIIIIIITVLHTCSML